MRNFGKSMLDLMKHNVTEIKKMVDEIDFDFSGLKTSISNALEDAKERIYNENGKFIIEIPYNRNTQILETKIEGNVFKVEAKPCTDCGELKVKTTFVSSTTLPENVITDSVEQHYNMISKTMFFIFNTTSNEEGKDKPKKGKKDKKNDSVESLDFNAIKEMIKMHKDGISFKKIAKEFGVSDKTVARRVRKFSHDAY